MINNLIVNYVRIIINLASFSSFIIAYKLWSNYKRSIPCVPVLNFINFDLPELLNLVLFITLLLTSLAIIFLSPSIYFFAINILISIVLVFFDINRLQPSFYLFLSLNILLLFYYLNKLSDADFINCCRMMLCAIYLWSGIYKINPDFYDVIYLWFIEPYLSLFQNLTIIFIIKNFGYLSPFIELIAAIGLLIPSSRKISATLIILMHLFIIITLAFIRQFNFSILPWNLSMMLMVYLLFYKFNRLQFVELKLLFYSKISLVMLTLFLLCPIFHFFGYWDTYLSHDLYSGKAKFGFLYFNDEVKNRLPEYFSEHSERIGGQNCVSLSKWSLEEIKNPVYPEIRVFKKYKKYMMKYLNDDDQIILVSYTRSASEVIK